MASAEHLATRFRRLEWATRYRPVHIQTLLLGAVTPAKDVEFVYADVAEFGGEAARVLSVAGIATGGKTAEAIRHELQRAGIFVAHVLECPLEENAAGNDALAQLLAKRLPNTLTRIRRSIKPKQMAPIAAELDFLLKKLTAEALGCAVILDGGRAFKLDEGNESVERLRASLAVSTTAAR
jgi:hypothetical protein